MFDVIGAGPLIGPWLGVWDLILDSPEAGIALAAALFAMATTGLGLVVLGGRRHQEPVETVAVVPARRPPRRMRRRR